MEVGGSGYVVLLAPGRRGQRDRAPDPLEGPRRAAHDRRGQPRGRTRRPGGRGRDRVGGSEPMTISERAGRPADPSILVDVDRLVRAYYDAPAGSGRSRRSGSRSARPAIAARRSTRPSTRPTSSPRPRRSAATARAQGTDGPLFIGRDTHALSEPAFRAALEVLARARRRRPGRRRRRLHADAGDLARDPGPQPRAGGDRLADGIVVTPSHNPPEDGGFKYNPPNGGPADTDVTGWIGDEANAPAGDAARGASSASRSSGRARPRPPHDFVGRVRRRPRRRSSTWTRSGRPACGSASTRWAARASPTGRRSPSATAST